MVSVGAPLHFLDNTDRESRGLTYGSMSGRESSVDPGRRKQKILMVKAQFVIEGSCGVTGDVRPCRQVPHCEELDFDGAIVTGGRHFVVWPCWPCRLYSPEMHTIDRGRKISHVVGSIGEHDW